ncbi:Methyltransferase domain-containing protein [Marinobacter daqiaonensis]|uniref:Methyltransferase domain-containing protein n=1 Tax=Marinobacter daqiaonensis TaxID=650891 RepID=A0A1I6GZG6_9GAMM|nr:class I SAM-dependent methyltransferase [Marinobacter daqiaonensis]SFR47497.1 Methyltransferase domain-containing protein [Marinobacter daqiaonensis]
MPPNKLYTDLSGYYDFMCADIDYQTQSQGVRRLHQLLGSDGCRHLDLACGTGPHIRHFVGFGYQSQGLDINQPMLDRAALRCPEAGFILGDMCDSELDGPYDLVTCFLYSLHYSSNIDQLKSCIANVHNALSTNGVFCFNAVDKTRINNSLWVTHTAEHEGARFEFSSGWYYPGYGDRQALKLSIRRTVGDTTESWQDEHPMVALTFGELRDILAPWFEVHVFEHDYGRIVPWDRHSGNALFACVKI